MSGATCAEVQELVGEAGAGALVEKDNQKGGCQIS